MTEWSGVVATQYGTIKLEEPSSPPADLDFDRYWEEKCAAIAGGVQISVPDQNGDVPMELRVLDAPGPVEDAWEHVAEIGVNTPGGRLQVFSWMADEDLAGEVDVPSGPLIARIHWAGLQAWLDHSDTNNHELAATDVRLRVDLVAGSLDEVRTLRTWHRWAPPVHESRRANGLRVFRGVAAARRLPTLEPERRSFWSPYPMTEEGSVTSLLRDPTDGSRWVRGTGGSWGYPFLQELSPEEAVELEALSFPQVRTYARDTDGRLWTSDQMPIARAPALLYVPPDRFAIIQQLFPADEILMVDLPDGWNRITRRTMESPAAVLVADVGDDAVAGAFYQRWPDGAEIAP